MVAATVGRLYDLITRDGVSLTHVNSIMLDGADEIVPSSQVEYIWFSFSLLLTLLLTLRVSTIACYCVPERPIFGPKTYV